MAENRELFVGQNLGFVEELFARFVDDPASVSDEWRLHFEPLVEDGAKIGPSFRPRSLFNPPSAGAAASVAPLEAASISLENYEGGTVEAKLPFLRSLTLFRAFPKRT